MPRSNSLKNVDYCLILKVQSVYLLVMNCDWYYRKIKYA